MHRWLVIFCNLLFWLSWASHLPAQNQPDSLQPLQLREISVRAQRETIQRLPSVQGAYLWSGIKNEVIQMQNLDANIAEKTPRQIFAKVPGVFVYDMDGAGNQTNISTRGLDPHRGWEFNIRANGFITNSDMYGYPASHFSLPLEAVSRIELVRGTGALQYGAQFGGMLNYVLKEPDTTKILGFETVNSIGSYGLLSAFNAIGGKTGRLQYYAFYSKRISDGYRENSTSDYDGQGAVLKFTLSPRLALNAQLLRSNYVYQIPGPLTDAMFDADPRQSTRSRNYFNPEIYVPSLSADWQAGARTRLQLIWSAVGGERRSVMFDRAANIPDTINANTLAFNTRQVDIDHFNSQTAELRVLQEFAFLNLPTHLAAGVQYMHNDLHRRQQGLGSTGTDFDLSVSDAGWGRDLQLKSQNLAFYVKTAIKATKRFSVSPGARFETGSSTMTGTTTYYDPEKLPATIKHQFPLLGVNANFDVNGRQQIYAGWAQAYRPVIFKDIIPATIYERTDRGIRDAFGYNLEAGWRGASNGLKWDLSVFRLQYNNRVGSVALEENGVFYILRTNIGHSVTHGLEWFTEYGFRLAGKVHGNLFTSTALFDARYQHAFIRIGNENRNIDGNKVESVPAWISRNGLNLRYNGFSVSVLYSYTGQTFADPLNTQAPSPTGAIGMVPAYGLLDVNLSCRLFGHMILRFNINNVAGKDYFTKRPTFYPGPGIWPSDGRSIQATVQMNL
ncbi:MAG: TonB-dependent receptor [Saprospirales bacterium]|nr:TonB-dependent receptor [Saprospirales bacterium]